MTLGASRSHRPVEPKPVTSTDTGPAEEEKAQSRSAHFMIHPLALKKRCWDWFIMLLVRPSIVRTRTIVPEECLTAHAGDAQVLYSLIMVPWMVAFTTQGSCGSAHAQANQCLPIAFKVSLRARLCALHCIYAHCVIAVRGHCRGCVFLAGHCHQLQDRCAELSPDGYSASSRITCVIGYLDDRREVHMQAVRVAKHYFCSWFLLDVLSVFPFKDVAASVIHKSGDM